MSQVHNIQVQRFRYYTNKNHLWINENLSSPLNANTVRKYCLWHIVTVLSQHAVPLTFPRLYCLFTFRVSSNLKERKCRALFVIWWRQKRTEYSIKPHHTAADHCTTYSMISSVNSSTWKSMTMTSFAIRAVHCWTHWIVFVGSSTMWSTCCNCKSNESINWVRRRCVVWMIERREIVIEAPKNDSDVSNVHSKPILPIVWGLTVGFTSTKRHSPKLQRPNLTIQSP